MPKQVPVVSELLEQLAEDFFKRRDYELMAAQDAYQYITDHRDRAAFREVDRQINALARAWDRMIDKLQKWAKEARAIERSVPSFYGD